MNWPVAPGQSTSSGLPALLNFGSGCMATESYRGRDGGAFAAAQHDVERDG